MRFAWAAPLCGLLLALAGCNAPKASADNGVPLPRVISKIVSLSPDTTEIIGELQLSSMLVGRTANCDYPPDVKSAIVVVQGTKPDFEKIAKIRPDLIVYDGKLYLDTDMQALNQSKPIVLKMDADTVDGLMDYIMKVGSLTGMGTAASELADKIYSAKERARASAPDQKVKVAVLMAGSGEYFAAGTESFLADVVSQCGGVTVGPPGKIFAPMSPEKLLADNPAIILVAGDASKVISDTRLASVRALKATPRAVFEVPEDYLFRPGPKTSDLIDNLSNKITSLAKAGALR